MVLVLHCYGSQMLPCSHIVVHKDAPEQQFDDAVGQEFLFVQVTLIDVTTVAYDFVYTQTFLVCPS